MAFLMLLCEKMKLTRKANQLTLKQLQYSNKVDRMQKKIKKRQDYYAKLEKQIERQATAYKNSANIFFSQQMGLGCNGVNLNNMYGTSMAAIQALSQWGNKDPMGNDIKPEDIEIAQAYMAGQYELDKETGDLKFKDGTIVVKKDEIAKYQQIQQMANSQVMQRQTFASQMKNNYENNVSIWQQAAEEELAMQKECELDMLEEEQSDMEAEKESIELQLKLVEERKKNIEQALGQAVSDSAPKFGLG